MKLTVEYIDTCLVDYLTDHYNSDFACHQVGSVDSLDKDDLIKEIENCLWPHIWEDINCNCITDEQIEKAADEFIEDNEDLGDTDNGVHHWVLVSVKDQSS